MSSNRPKHLKFDSQIKGAPSVDQRVRGACVRVTKAHTARTSIDSWPAINMDKGLIKITFRRLFIPPDDFEVYRLVLFHVRLHVFQLKNQIVYRASYLILSLKYLVLFQCLLRDCMEGEYCS